MAVQLLEVHQRVREDHQVDRVAGIDFLDLVNVAGWYRSGVCPDYPWRRSHKKHAGIRMNADRYAHAHHEATSALVDNQRVADVGVGIRHINGGDE